MLFITFCVVFGMKIINIKKKLEGVLVTLGLPYVTLGLISLLSGVFNLSEFMVISNSGVNIYVAKGLIAMLLAANISVIWG